VYSCASSLGTGRVTQMKEQPVLVIPETRSKTRARVPTTATAPTCQQPRPSFYAANHLFLTRSQLHEAPSGPDQRDRPGPNAAVTSMRECSAQRAQARSDLLEPSHPCLCPSKLPLVSCNWACA